LTKWQDWIKYYPIAGVVELADTLRSGRSEHSARESSNLSFGINATKMVAFFLSTGFVLRRGKALMVQLLQRIRQYEEFLGKDKAD